MVWIYSLLSVVVISLLSFVGVLAFLIKKELLGKVLLYLVSFSVGALLGDVFLHIIPEVAEKEGFSWQMGGWFLAGLILFFVIEKFIHWHHCHKPEHSHKIQPMAYTNLIGDAFHNFLDGVIIASSFMVSIPIGIATTLAVVFHEIPQEIGDFGVLLYAGFRKRQALLFNFLSACMAILGAILTLFILHNVAQTALILLALAGGGFIYIAGSDLIPALHREQTNTKQAVGQLVMIVFGMAIMALLLLVE